MGFVANYLLNLLGAQRPLLASWYATHRCPRRCPHCSDGAGAPFAVDPRPELDTAAACALVDAIARDCDTLDVTGGEPLLRPDLGAILAHAKSRGLRTVLNTRSAAICQRPEVLAASDVVVFGLDALQPAAVGAATGEDETAGAAMLAALVGLQAQRPRQRHGLVLSCVARPGHLADCDAVLAYAIAGGLGFHCSPQLVGSAIHPDLAADPGWPALAERIRQARRAGHGVLGCDAYHRGIRDLAPYRCRPELMPTIDPLGRLWHPCLETGRADIDVVAAGGLLAAMRQAGRAPRCDRSCPIFCHMALSLLQSRPLQALDEMRRWRSA